MSIRNLTAAAAILVAALPSQAAAEDWILIGSDGDIRFEVQSGSISRTGNLVRFWTRFTNPELDAEIIIALQQVNCSTGQLRQLQQTEYYRDGRVQTFRTPTEWTYVIPGSFGEAAQDFGCAQ